MSAYAKGTTVSEAKSKAEIEAMLRRYGAGEFASMWKGDDAIIAFKANGRLIRFNLPLPKKSEERFWYSKGSARRRKVWRSRSDRGQATAERAWQQEIRRRWRALALVIKAKLEAVESGIESFEVAFLSHTVVPGSTETFGDWAAPRLAAAYEAKQMPPLLPARSR